MCILLRQLTFTRSLMNKLAGLEATLFQNYDPPIDLMTDRVGCRATSVAKKYSEIYRENNITNQNH